MAPPGVVCSETFLVIGPFDSQEELLNCKKYIETNFFRVLLFFGRGTMQVSQEVFRFIPLQDFTSSIDIDWLRSIRAINSQLYAKYHFTHDEVHYIENLLRK